MMTVRVDDIDDSDGFRNLGELWSGPLDEFLADNSLTEVEMATIRSLPVGASFLSGGGAAPMFRLTRLT